MARLDLGLGPKSRGVVLFLAGYLACYVNGAEILVDGMNAGYDKVKHIIEPPEPTAGERIASFFNPFD